MTRSNEERVYTVLPQSRLDTKVIVSAFSIFAIFSLICILGFSVHKIYEGRDSIYLDHGALKDKILNPGINWKIPFFKVYSTMFLNIVHDDKSNIATTMNHPKPILPSDIANNYKERKIQWTEQLVDAHQQKTEKIKKESQNLKANADAEREKKVLDIDIQKKVVRKEGDQ